MEDMIQRQTAKDEEEAKLLADPAYGEAKKAYEVEQKRLREEKEKAEMEAMAQAKSMSSEASMNEKEAAKAAQEARKS